MLKKVSIITVCKNSITTIENTIKSVACQSYPNIEHIVVDGGSVDGTLQLLIDYSNRCPNVKLLTGSDNGIYDAMNKGMLFGTGEIFCFLNSDDIYIDPSIVSQIAFLFNRDHPPQIVYSDLRFISSKSRKVTRYWKSGKYSFLKMYTGWLPPHPTVFFESKVLINAGMFNINFKIASDIDWMQRIFLNSDINIEYLPIMSVEMMAGGASNSGFNNIFKANYETYIASKANGLNPTVFVFFKILRKIFQIRL